MKTSKSQTLVVLLTLFSAAAIFTSVSIADEIIIGVEIGPTSLYGPNPIANQGFLNWSQDGMPADTFGYRYLEQGGFTYDWGAIDPPRYKTNENLNHLTPP